MKIAALFLAALPAMAQSAPAPSPATAADQVQPGSTPATAAAPVTKSAISAPASVILPASSPVAAPDGPLEFSEVVPVEGIAATELFTRGKLWFAETFRDSKNVLEIVDEKAGLLVGKGSMKYESDSFSGSAQIRGYITFHVQMMVKEGRYKITFSNFIHSGTPVVVNDIAANGIDFGLITNSTAPPTASMWTGGNAGWRQKRWVHLKLVCKNDSESLTASLKKRMAQPSTGADNW